jgi:triacylglycerol esterase/lipase EstA (alpha/beta hydrolase family)
MARILNLIIVILELIGFFKARKKKHDGKGPVTYTQLANCVTFVSSMLLVILGQKAFVEVLRLLSVSMLAVTLVVTVCILVPVSGHAADLLLFGGSLFRHLLIPVISVLSYGFAENKAGMAWILLPVAVTAAYGIIMVYLNAVGKAEGPYPFFRVKKIGTKLTALWMGGLIVMTTVISGAVGFRRAQQTDIKYIFVHGLSGWGSYDILNEFFPYWGLSGGSIIRYLNNRGYRSYAASVDPTGSAWDRACELYAQLAGTRVDYGEAHSKAAGHERFGRDFTGKALIKDFDSSRIALIGHSFGGATVRLFSEILRNGSAEERAATDPGDISPFFMGGNGDGLVAVVTLAAPTNGTTAYDMHEDTSFDPGKVTVPDKYEKNSDAVSKGTRPVLDGRASWDYASFDMHIDNALALNEKITTFDDVYYFAYPCSSSTVNPDGSVEPDPSITENIFMKSAIQMSKYTGVTRGGFRIDKTWQSNDGLVNEISAGAPFGALQSSYDANGPVVPGRWYVMPVFRGDHMSLQGGLTKRINIKPFYIELVRDIIAKSCGK